MKYRSIFFVLFSFFITYNFVNAETLLYIRGSEGQFVQKVTFNETSLGESFKINFYCSYISIFRNQKCVSEEDFNLLNNLSLPTIDTNSNLAVSNTASISVVEQVREITPTPVAQSSVPQVIYQVIERAVPGPQGPAGRDGVDGRDGTNNTIASFFPNISTGAEYLGYGSGSANNPTGDGSLASLSVSGDSSFGGKVTGAGLLSCNTLTSKILYNSTSGKFECGTDQSGSGFSGGDITAQNVYATTSLQTPVLYSSTTNASTSNINNANIISLLSTNGTITNSLIVATSSITNLNVSSALYSALANITSATIVTLFGSSANFVTANASTTNSTTSNATTYNGTTGNIATVNSSILNSQYIYASTTFATTSNASTSNISEANIINEIVTNSTITNATSTSLFTSILNSLTSTFVNLIFSNATGTNATTTNFFTTNLNSLGNFVLGTGTIASTTITDASINNASITTLHVENFSPNSISVNLATFTSGTSTNWFTQNSSSTNSNIGNLAATNATFSYATVTNGFFTNLSVTGPVEAALNNGFIFRGGTNNISEATSTLFVADSGKIGVGSTTPSEKLSVEGNLLVSGSIVAPYFSNLETALTGDNILCIDVSGRVKIDTTQDCYSNYSDMRLKQNIATVTSVLDKVGQLTTVNFNWIDESRGTSTQLGYIAQDVQKVFPEVVREDTSGFLKVNYISLSAIYANAIKELLQKVLGIDSRVERLEARMNDLENKLNGQNSINNQNQTPTTPILETLPTTPTTPPEGQPEQPLETPVLPPQNQENTPPEIIVPTTPTTE